MASGSLLLRFAIGLPLLLGLILIGAVEMQTSEPIFNATTSDSMQGAENQGWDHAGTIMQFLSIGLVSLTGVVLLWIVFGSLTEDVQQSRRRF